MIRNYLANRCDFEGIQIFMGTSLYVLVLTLIGFLGSVVISIYFGHSYFGLGKEDSLGPFIFGIIMLGLYCMGPCIAYAVCRLLDCYLHRNDPNPNSPISGPIRPDVEN